MCRFCDEGRELDDARAQLLAHGVEVLQPNAPVQFGVLWDGRVVAHSEKRERAVQMAAEQNASNPGRWEAVVRRVGAWVPVEVKP